MFKQETKKQICSSNIQSFDELHRNYLSGIRGDDNKLLEYISRTGEILIQYYTNPRGPPFLNFAQESEIRRGYIKRNHNLIIFLMKIPMVPKIEQHY